MNLRTELVEENQKILIVSLKKFPFLDILKENLNKHGGEIFSSPQMPKNLNQFDYCFLINEPVNADQINQSGSGKIVLIFVNRSRDASRLAEKFKKTKVIDIEGDQIGESDVDRILWFSLSQSKERFLRLTVPKLKKVILPRRHFFTKKRLAITIIGLIIFLHFAFIPPLLLSTYFSYQSFAKIKQEKIGSASAALNISNLFLSVSQRLYAVVRPTYLLFSLAIPSDTLISIEQETNVGLNQSIAAMTNIKKLAELFFKTDKTDSERNSLILRLNMLKQQINDINDSLTSINQQMPTIEIFKKWHGQLSEATDATTKLEKILEFSDIIFAKNSEKKYLLLFANNMELRPGGGFLGSFGIVDIKDYTINDIKIYDVYDADGQLLVHIEPPVPIKKYLNIPHWFLRDSNFSPDFLEDYQKAQFFLDKEMNLSNFSGAILFTTTGIENILSAFGNIYVPDFNEVVNDKNFYLKAQIYSEKNFFPGSIQKKAFLGALTKQILLNINNVSAGKLALALKKSLDEKQIVFYSDDQQFQNVLDSFYWSGRVIEPQCTSSDQNCITDYLFPYDANVGANKANFFITRSLLLQTSIDNDGTIKHTLSIQYKNEAQSDVFPGGTYRNFFQVLLPKDSQILQVTKDGTLVEDVEETEDQLKTVKFYFEVPPTQTTEIKISYQLASSLAQGTTMYQLIAQKQIGAPNSDFTLDFTLPTNISVLNHNFSPLVKEGEIIYNTNLTTDKIFFIELAKQ